MVQVTRLVKNLIRSRGAWNLRSFNEAISTELCEALDVISWEKETTKC